MNTKLCCRVTALLLVLVLSAIGCKKNLVTPVPEPLINVTVVDVSCTEAWVRIKTEGFEKLNNLRLFVNDVHVPEFVLTTNDTLVYLDSLKIKQAYTFTVIGSYRDENDKERPVSSAKQKTTTLDTTSHNFSWQTWTFGTVTSNMINDVVIINENDIWAGGEIHTDKTDRYDSLGKWVDPYNVAHWNGIEWELKTVYYVENGVKSWGAIRAIYAFSENDIWFGIGRLIHWNGSAFVSVKQTEGTFSAIINQMWGTSSSDLYLAGTRGAIAHFDGTKWEKIESGTTLDIFSIGGEKKLDGSGYEILCSAGTYYTSTPGKILSIVGNKVVEKSTDGLPLVVRSIWLKPDRRYIAVGNGVYDCGRLGDTWKSNLWPGKNYGLCVQGENYNDIFVSGLFGLLLHFNGNTWKMYQNEIGAFDAEYVKIHQKGNIVAVCGIQGRNGIICIGKRQ